MFTLIVATILLCFTHFVAVGTIMAHYNPNVLIPVSRRSLILAFVWVDVSLLFAAFTAAGMIANLAN